MRDSFLLQPQVFTGMWFVGLLLMQSLTAQGFPLHMRGEDLRNSNLFINNGELPLDRSIFTIISLVCMMVLSLLLGKCTSHTVSTSESDDIPFACAPHQGIHTKLAIMF